MNRSAPLSTEARRLLELGTQVAPMTPEQEQRMDRALGLLFRAGRAAPGSGTNPPPSERNAANDGPAALSETGSAVGERGVVAERGAPERSAIHRRPSPPGAAGRAGSLLQLGGAKPWLALGALVATASASFWLGRVSSPGEVTSRLEQPVSASPAPPPASSSVPLEGPSDVLAQHAVPAVREAEPVGEAAAAAPSSAAASAAGAASASSPSSVQVAIDAERPRARGARTREPLGLGAEVEQLARVEAALRGGRAEQAIALLEQRAVHHLHEQAAALRAIAGCELQGSAAAASARELLERWPASAFRARVARACGL